MSACQPRPYRSTAGRCISATAETTFDLDDHVYRALRAGASGFLLKDTIPPGLLDAIRTVAAGEALLAPTITRRLIAAFTSRPTAVRSPDGVTPREREVLTLPGQDTSPHFDA